MTEYLIKKELIRWLNKEYGRTFSLLEEAGREGQVYYEKLLEGRCAMIRDLRDYILCRKSICYDNTPKECATIIQDEDIKMLTEGYNKLKEENDKYKKLVAKVLRESYDAALTKDVILEEIAVKLGVDLNNKTIEFEMPSDGKVPRAMNLIMEEWQREIKKILDEANINEVTIRYGDLVD